MTQTILLSCPPNTPESDAALHYCLTQALQHLGVTCVFFVGHGVAHAFEQHNASLNEWQNLYTAHQIPLYCCTHSTDQFVTSNTVHHNSTPQIKNVQLKTLFQTAGLGLFVEACVNSSAVISFAPQNISCTPNSSTTHTVNTDAAVTNGADPTSQLTSIARQETGRSIVFHLYSHDIMCHVSMNVLFNIASMLLIFEQKVTIHLQGNKSNLKANGIDVETRDTNNWTSHHATALVNLKGMGMDTLTLDEQLVSEFAAPLRDLDICVVTTTNTQTPEHRDESKSIYI